MSLWCSERTGLDGYEENGDLDNPAHVHSFIMLTHLYEMYTF